MEEVTHPRKSSGVYDAAYGSAPSLASNVALRAPAEPPSTGASRGEDSEADEGHEKDGQAKSTSDQAPAVPFYKKRSFIISQIILTPISIALIFILLFPVSRAIVQLVVNKATLDIQTATISNPSNTSFLLSLSGNVAHTSQIPAIIRFTEPVRVAWVHDGNVTEIGTMVLPDPLQTQESRATLDQNTTFNITDTDAFGLFAQSLITSSNFTWLLQSQNLRVNAAKFPVANGISFNKYVTLNGLQSFNGAVILQDLQLPSDNPAGGINFIAETELINNSPFTLDLGTVLFKLQYQNVFLGVGTGKNVKLVKGTNSLSISGYLVRQDTEADLTILSNLFTNYLNGGSTPILVIGQSSVQDDGTSVSWLSSGLQALTLTVPFAPLTPVDPIKSITIGELALDFNAQTPWAPIAQSNTVTANMKLPFGFNISIDEIRNDFNISRSGSLIAGLSTPPGASHSDISVHGPADTEGNINITIANTALIIPENQYPAFSSFNAALTTSQAVEFNMIGNVYATATTSIGALALGPIKVNVSTGLKGLGGLSGVSINAIDITGATLAGIDLGIHVTINNPSNLKLNIGDLTLHLQCNDTTIGNVIMRNLTLDVGDNSVFATSTLTPNGIPEAVQTLNDFVNQKAVPLTIAGFNGSTDVASLREAMETLRINITLPSLPSPLLASASIIVLPTTAQNNISHVQVVFNNPFSADLRITYIKSTVSSFGIPLGVIDTATDIHVVGKSTVKSPALDLNMNLDPPVLFTLTRKLAIEAGLNVAPLDAIVALGGYHYLPSVNESVSERQSDLFTGFDFPSFIQTAFKKLRSDIHTNTSLSIGNYQTTLAISQSQIPTTTDSSLSLLLPSLAQPIVEHILTGTNLGIDKVLITSPQEYSFNTQLQGRVWNAGPFDANISFPTGLTISWGGAPLGNIEMKDIRVVGDIGAAFSLNALFTVANVTHLTDFTKTLLTQQTFEWSINGENLTVTALGIDVPQISLPAKQVTLNGFNGLKGNVQIETFDLPSDDPTGGIHLTVETKIANPSQVGIQLESITFDTTVGDTIVASIRSTGQVLFAPGSGTELALTGRLIPQTTPIGLATVSTIFNNFLHGIDSKIVMQGAAAGPAEVTWLNEGIQILKIETVLPNRGAQNVVKSITINQLALLFSKTTAYEPSTSSNSTDVAFQIPFEFPLDIKTLEPSLVIGFEGASVAQLKIPKGPGVTDLQKRIVSMKFINVPFTVLDDQHSSFDRFLTSTTLGKQEELQISGAANVDAQTAVGLISLQNITFGVNSQIFGLEGLDALPPTISQLDINHGYSNYLLIRVESTLFNPSTLTIGTDDVTFLVQYEGQTIGSAQLNKLVILPGNSTYPIDIHYAPEGTAINAGRAMIQIFLGGNDADALILGTSDSTPIQSLKQALSQINLPIRIPALKENLVKHTSITFPIDIISTGIALASFTLANPFTAKISVFRLNAIAQYHNLTLGVIESVDVSSNPIEALGHDSVTSPALPMRFNLDSKIIVQVVTAAAKEKNIDLGPLAEILQYVTDHPSPHSQIVAYVDTKPPTCISGNQFDFSGTLLSALSAVNIDLEIHTSVKLDDYATDLDLEQRTVSVGIDSTALYLIGAVAGPTAQHFVDDAVLAFSSAEVTNIADNGFDLHLVGSLTNTGPLDALITFVEPLSVAWNNQEIAQLLLEPICTAANQGVPNYRPTAKLTIIDDAKFTSFATSLLHDPDFEWIISTDKLRLTALGTVFDNISFSKAVSFKAFNGLPGVSISNFDLPSDDPAGGIRIETDVTIPSHAQLGLNLGTVTFQSFFQDTLIGPLVAEKLTLAPQSSTVSHFSGHLLPQTGSMDLSNVGKLFSTFLAGGNAILLVKRESIIPSGASEPVKWLSEAFRTLELPVTLPGKQFKMIQSVELDDLDILMLSQEQAFMPLMSSNNTLAKYQTPFGFTLQIITISLNLTVKFLGMDIAQLKIPEISVEGGAFTGNIVELRFSFMDLPLISLNDGGFQQLFAAGALQNVIDFELRGTTDVFARTPIGNVPITGISFDVPTQFQGIAAFDHKASLSNISITGSGGQGGSEYIVAPVTATLDNPSNISLETDLITIPITYQGVVIGRSSVSLLNLRPGVNALSAEFHYQPGNSNDTIAQSFLARFIQTQDMIPITLDGDYQSSPYASLQPAIAGLHIPTSVQGLNHPNILTHINVYVTLATLVTNRVAVDFDVYNPLETDITIEYIQAEAIVNGKIYAQFSQAFQSFTIPAGATVNSGVVDNAFLTRGAINSLYIISLGSVDVDSRSTIRIGSSGGYQIPWLPIQEKHVPATYHV
ncbi:hypothetical protein M378DRAFT_21838 [Amanita muscaria Koide BX008]|uniref:Uncharacterized protein n=1 Tax=Amanita muscaria (strain Koide BX008) TaxID=946122 RepID=A0A0C2XIY0_AMAMK|nr:hypothetical protein M378DRAFT_21838 [Amanita muscaria Koide BX008]